MPNSKDLKRLNNKRKNNSERSLSSVKSKHRSRFSSVSYKPKSRKRLKSKNLSKNQFQNLNLRRSFCKNLQ